MIKLEIIIFPLVQNQSSLKSEYLPLKAYLVNLKFASTITIRTHLMIKELQERQYYMIFVSLVIDDIPNCLIFIIIKLLNKNEKIPINIPIFMHNSFECYFILK